MCIIKNSCPARNHASELKTCDKMCILNLTWFNIIYMILLALKCLLLHFLQKTCFCVTQMILITSSVRQNKCYLFIVKIKVSGLILRHCANCIKRYEHESLCNSVNTSWNSFALSEILLCVRCVNSHPVLSLYGSADT